MTARVRPLSVIALTIWFFPAAFAQTRPQGSTRRASVARVLFVGCKADGQVGPLPAPTEVNVVRIDASVAPRLAYYKPESGPGVLAPLGWYCFGTYGSGGSSLLVAPKPINEDTQFSQSWQGFAGPAIALDDRSGGASGRFAVAEVMARVFPKQKALVQNVIDEGLDAVIDFKFGPYPRDKLIYRNDRVVEYSTPPHTNGLGTMSWFHRSDESIDGVVILHGPTPDLLRLMVRLPADLESLKSHIIRQLENEWGDEPKQ